MNKYKKGLEKLLEEYRYFSNEDELVAATERLAQLYNFSQTDFIDKRKKFEIVDMVESELENNALLTDFLKRVSYLEERISRITGFGGSLDEDEIFLLISFAMEIELGINLFTALGNEIKVEQELTYETLLQEVFDEPANRQKLSSCLKTIQKNLLLPISSKWLH